MTKFAIAMVKVTGIEFGFGSGFVSGLHSAFEFHSRSLTGSSSVTVIKIAIG